ncbi:MAG TPA: nucleotide exchange factor GrpE [Deltaproteobacteria bacterium]|nr:nucleotide exchange factor GrpE [Deltaproteobacteria bacterium]
MKVRKEHAAKQDQLNSREEAELTQKKELSGEKEREVKLEEKEKEAAENYDKFVRAVAELDNYKKRALKEKADTVRYANEELIKDILPFMDSLDRAMEHTGGPEVEKFKEGIRLIQEQLLCCLEKHGVQKIESSGADFDPNYHEAMMQVHSDEHEENEVVSEIATGYLLNGRLLRPSKVCVCKKTSEKKADNGE